MYISVRHRPGKLGTSTTIGLKTVLLLSTFRLALPCPSLFVFYLLHLLLSPFSVALTRPSPFLRTHRRHHECYCRFPFVCGVDISVEDPDIGIS
ncbi:hypothetical protein K435DRAFT_303066 [Dendrothele bispora CBS 962.96]|uniref:Uncharacterized protein n=1 Tax=Dendrothele bispora (strain CBS 962.96) TaxID=1314807 RepID=A0A4S8LJN5_DENBC|nr:hypothetical protein K435DRAFT_303066 [Dendrothele bispora CBS 962.96]